MTSRERVLAACAHRQPDRTPIDFGGTLMSLCTSEFLAKTRQILGLPLPEDRDADGVYPDEAIQRHLQVDLRVIPHAPPLVVLKEIDPAGYEREWANREARKKALADTAASGVKTYAVRHNHPLAELSLKEILALKPNRPETGPPRYLDWMLQTAKAYRADGYATTYWVSGGFFEQGCATRGYELFSMDLAEEPDLVRALFDLWLAEKLPLVETVVKPLAEQVDWFCFGDDLGMQTSPFLSSEMFREQVLPYMAEYYRAVQQAAPNAFIFHHSCGSVYRLMDDLVEAGVRVLNPVQPNAFEMEPERLKEKAKGRLCLHGGIDLQELLPFGKPEEVRAETLRRMRILGEGGGYVCAPAHSLPEDVPVENILAMFGA